jgi:hypothetical protein
MTYIVKYQVATYAGEIEVYASEELETEQVIARAKNQLRRKAGDSLPFGYQHFKIVKVYR